MVLKRTKTVGYCPTCQKQLYASKKDARKAAKEIAPNAHPSIYPCPIRPAWHWGNLNPKIIAGKTTREAYK